MAKVGGGAAYQKLQVPADGISQAMQFWGGREAENQAAKKLADEREGIRKKKEISDWEATYNLKEGDFKNKYTGFKSFDDMNTDFSMYATNEYVNLQRQAKEALSNGNLSEKTRIEGEMIRLKNAFGEAAKSQEFFGQKFADYKDAVSKGKVSGASKDFEDIVQEAIMNKNVALRMVDGNLVYTGMKEGKDGTREPFTVPYQDLMDGSFSYYQKQQISGEGGIVDNVLNDLGTITKQGQNGYYQITTQAWDESIHGKSVDDAIEAMLGNDEVMGDVLFQFSQGKTSKMFGFDDKDYDLVKPKLKEMIRAGYSEKFGSEFNNSKYNTDSAAALAREKKTKTQDEATLSKLHYDAEQFESGDYTGLLGRFTNEYDEVKTITKVVPSDDPNIVIAVTEDGYRLPVVNTKRGFLEFKIRGNSEYKKYTPDAVLDQPVDNYRSGTVGESGITSVLSGQYNAAGKFVGEETKFVNSLRKLYPNAKIEEAVIGENAIKLNGVKINLDEMTQQQVEDKLREELGSNRIKLTW